jgi:hypothetical protein
VNAPGDSDDRQGNSGCLSTWQPRSSNTDAPNRVYYKDQPTWDWTSGAACLTLKLVPRVTDSAVIPERGWRVCPGRLAEP